MMLGVACQRGSAKRPVVRRSQWRRSWMRRSGTMSARGASDVPANRMKQRARSRLKFTHAKRGPAWGKLVAAALFIAALAAAWRYTPLAEWISAERVVGWARAVREHTWAPLIVVLA